MIYLPAILLAFVLLAIITRPFTVLLHELGHAIPGMIFSKKNVAVYVGSFGNKEQSFKIPIGTLEIWIRYNPIKWGGGLCIIDSEDVSINKMTIFTLCGPLFSFAIAAALFYVTLNYDLHGALKLIFAFAFFSTLFDLVFNLIPRKFEGPDGTIFFSDGYLLFNQKKIKEFPKEYEDAVNIYANNNYEKSAPIFEDFISRGLVSEDVYRYASVSNMMIGNYAKASEIQKKFESKYALNADDQYNFGITCAHLDKNKEMNEYFDNALNQDPNHSYTLNTLGYNLIANKEYSEAILLFDKVIDNHKDFAFAYNNRGHAKIEMGQLNEGLLDITHSLELDNKNAYVYRNLGIYHLRLKEKKVALKYFMQAQEMDNSTDLIEDLIVEAKSSSSNG